MITTRIHTVTRLSIATLSLAAVALAVSGNVTLVNLGPGAVIVGAVSGNH